MGGAKYQTYTAGDVGWGNSTRTWTAPTIYSGDIGIGRCALHDGRQNPAEIEWPNGTLCPILIENPSTTGGAWTGGNGFSYSLNPSVGAQTVGMNLSNYQSRADAIRISGARKSLIKYTHEHSGGGQGSGGKWTHEPAAGNIDSPFALCLSSYVVGVGNNPVPCVVDGGAEQTKVRGGTLGPESSRGHAWGYTMEGVGADTPIHSWHRGSTAGTYDNSGIYAEIEGIEGGVSGIIIMQIKRFLGEMGRGLIPPLEWQKRWDWYFGHLPPVGTPVLSATWLNENGSLGEFHSIETVELYGYKNKHGVMIGTLIPNKFWRNFNVQNLLDQCYAHAHRSTQFAYARI